MVGTVRRDRASLHRRLDRLELAIKPAKCRCRGGQWIVKHPDEFPDDYTWPEAGTPMWGRVIYEACPDCGLERMVYVTKLFRPDDFRLDDAPEPSAEQPLELAPRFTSATRPREDQHEPEPLRTGTQLAPPAAEDPAPSERSETSPRAWRSQESKRKQAYSAGVMDEVF
jgi:hypothetical protein